MPILGDPGHARMVEFLQDFGARNDKPSAVVLVSAHWEESQPTIISSVDPGLYYDYGGFPPEAYDIDYPVPGHPELAGQVHSLLSESGLKPAIADDRGLDHGVFIPLMLMYPDASVPVVQVSLVRGLDPELHIDIGRAISALEWDDLLIIGSGMSFHNMRAMMSGDPTAGVQGEQFHSWLHETCVQPDLAAAERENRLINWTDAPSGRFCHPREEHLIPLHVCYGASMGLGAEAELVFHDEIMATNASGLLWQ